MQNGSILRGFGNRAVFSCFAGRVKIAVQIHESIPKENGSKKVAYFCFRVAKCLIPNATFLLRKYQSFSIALRTQKKTSVACFFSKLRRFFHFILLYIITMHQNIHYKPPIFFTYVQNAIIF